jgi:hypothetical protein
MSASCAACRWSSLDYDDKTLTCHRNPPVSGWPEVRPDDWCGDFVAGVKIIGTAYGEPIYARPVEQATQAPGELR